MSLTPAQKAYCLSTSPDLTEAELGSKSLSALMNQVETDLQEKGKMAPWLTKFQHGIGVGSEAGENDYAKTYSLFPIPPEDQVDWEYFQAQQVQNWLGSELDMSKDKKEYAILDRRTQMLYKDLLGFFLPGDGIISQSCIRFLLDAKTFCSQAFLIAQLHIEVVHAESYGLAVTAIIPDQKEQKEVMDMVDNLECVKAKARFIKELVDSDAPLNERLLTSACCEGIFFVTLFAIIFYMRTKGVMKTFIFLNKQVAADETLHRDYFMAKCKSVGAPSRERCLDIITRAVDIEIEHLKYILREPVDSIERDSIAGLTIENLSNYARGLADQILLGTGHSPHYNVKVELPWMAEQMCSKRANFYEVQAGNYKKISKDEAINYMARINGVEEVVNDDGVVKSSVTNPEDIDF